MATLASVLGRDRGRVRAQRERSRGARPFPFHPDCADGRGGTVGRGLLQRTGRGGRSEVRREDRLHAALGPDRGRARAVPAPDGPQGRRPAPRGVAELGERGRRGDLRVRRAGPAQSGPFLAALLSQGHRGPSRRVEPDDAPERGPAGDPGDDRGRDDPAFVAARAGPAHPRRGLPRDRRQTSTERRDQRPWRRRSGDVVAADCRPILGLHPGHDQADGRGRRQGVRGDPRFCHARAGLAARAAGDRGRSRGRSPVRERPGRPRRVGRRLPRFRRATGGHGRRPPVHRRSVTVRDDGTVLVEADDPVARPWLQDQLESIVMHRLAGNGGSSSDQDRPVLRFADDQDDHPLGGGLLDQAS